MTADPAAARRSPRYMPADWTLPLLTEASRPFFTSGVLMLQRCRACQAVQHPPLDVCRACQGLDLEPEMAAGTGFISSYTVVHHATDRRLDRTVPYNVIVVELDDHPGVMIVGNLIDWRPGEDIRAGTPVQVSFAVVDDEETDQPFLLPQWERAAAHQQGEPG